MLVRSAHRGGRHLPQPRCGHPPGRRGAGRAARRACLTSPAPGSDASNDVPGLAVAFPLEGPPGSHARRCRLIGAARPGSTHGPVALCRLMACWKPRRISGVRSRGRVRRRRPSPAGSLAPRQPTRTALAVGSGRRYARRHSCIEVNGVGEPRRSGGSFYGESSKNGSKCAIESVVCRVRGPMWGSRMG
jgi:hypothetical protein